MTFNEEVQALVETLRFLARKRVAILVDAGNDVLTEANTPEGMAAELTEKLAALPDKWWRESENRFGERIRSKYELEIRAIFTEVLGDE